MTILSSRGLKIAGEKLWEAEHAPSKMHELHVWKPDLEPEDPQQRDRIIQVHQNLNLARIAELANASAKSLSHLVTLGWLIVVLLILNLFV